MNPVTTPSDDGEMVLRLCGHLDPHPWLQPADTATSEDAFSLCRARSALMGWDTTFSSMPGDRRELFGLLDASLTGLGAGELCRFRVQPAQPAAVHRYLPTLAAAVQDTLGRLGTATITDVLVDLPPADADPQSLPYLLSARNWFGCVAPGSGTNAVLGCDGPRAADQMTGLNRLAGLVPAPFAIDQERMVVVVPEWTVTATCWVLAVVTTAMRETGFAEGLRVRLQAQ